MPGLRRLKRLLLSLAAIALAAPAFAGPADMAAARQGGHWAGCVYQPGYDPYRIDLDRMRFGLLVTYPELCRGIHAPLGPAGETDAVEQIKGDVGVCIPTVDVDYRLKGKTLYLDYFLEGKMIAQARLRNVPKGTAPPLCNPSGTIS